MKQIKVKIETSVETTLGGRPVNELIRDIADLCREKLQYSTSKEEKCEMLYEDAQYEDAQYEDYCNAMEERVSTLESALSQILNILED